MPADGMPGAPQHITLIRKGLTLNIGKHYHFSFKAKGTAHRKLHWHFRSAYRGAPATVKVERDERGGVKRVGFRGRGGEIHRADFKRRRQLGARCRETSPRAGKTRRSPTKKR